MAKKDELTAEELLERAKAVLRHHAETIGDLDLEDDTAFSTFRDGTQAYHPPPVEKPAEAEGETPEAAEKPAPEAAEAAPEPAPEPASSNRITGGTVRMKEVAKNPSTDGPPSEKTDYSKMAGDKLAAELADWAKPNYEA